ncbi:MAG: hypothetical protein ACK5AY_01260 [Bacteroidota bacterium]
MRLLQKKSLPIRERFSAGSQLQSSNLKYSKISALRKNKSHPSKRLKLDVYLKDLIEIHKFYKQFPVEIMAYLNL